MILLFVACRSGTVPTGGTTTADRPWPPSVVSGPYVIQPVELAPYARHVSYVFDRSVSLEGEATDGEHVIPVATGPSVTPSYPLVGLYADRTWTVEVEAVDAEGRRAAIAPVTFTTAPLPEGWPHVDLVASGPDMEPGFTLVPFIEPDTDGWLAVLDHEGEVAWLYEGVGAKFLETHVLPDHHLVVMHGETDLLELDWQGVRYRRLYATNDDVMEGTWVDLPKFHHELLLGDDGTWVVMSRERVSVERYPVSYTSPLLGAPSDVGTDRIVSLDPDSGDVVEEWSLGEGVLDMGRIGYLSLEGTDFGKDWTHANSVSADDAGDRWIVSVRHQDAIVAIDRSTNAVDWILGTPDNWVEPWASARLQPVGEVRWPWHTHAAKWIGDGRVLLFDNGNFGVSPWTGLDPLEASEVHSRVVMYRVDDAARTVSEEWTFEPDPYVYSQAMGDADLLPGGTVLANFAHVDRIGGVETAGLGRGASSFLLLEFDPGTGEVVWGVDVWGDATGLYPDWRSYRAERFASFGPGGVLP